MKPRLHLETTIPSYLVARESRDVIQRGQQAATRKWWEQRRGDYALFVSEFVDLEAGRGDAEMSAARAAAVRGLPRLAATKDARELAAAILGTGLIPAKASGRLAHRGGRRASDGYFADLELHAHPQHSHQPASRAPLRAGGLAVSRDLHSVRFAGNLNHETKCHPG